MSRGPTMEWGGHLGSWYYAHPHLDGIRILRLCQPQKTTCCSSSQNEAYFGELQFSN